MIAIVDYGMGNLRSVQKALEKVGAQTFVTSDQAAIARADKIVLPGVGAMRPAMNRLQELGLVEVIPRVIKSGKPFLGICLGMQLLFDKSYEGGEVSGLGVLSGSVKIFQGKNLKVPHMGWNQLKFQQSCSMFQDVRDESDVYFCHSYFVDLIGEGAASLTDYSGFLFVSSVCRGNVWAVQFHPEKSQKIGLKILENFVRI